MAKEYIDRERMIKCFCGHCMAEGTEDCIDCYDKKLIQNLPAADVRENVKGQWYDVGSLSCRCSACGCKSNRETAFCPNCGAQMGGAEDG